MAIFTPETAAIAGRKSHLPTSARYLRPVEPDIEPQQSDQFRRERLAYTRAEIVRIQKVMSDCEDAKQLQAYATAVAKLFEAEQKLSMRPNPGVLKPSSIKPKRAQLIEIMPIPSPLDPPANDPNEPNG